MSAAEQNIKSPAAAGPAFTRCCAALLRLAGTTPLALTGDDGDEVDLDGYDAAMPVLLKVKAGKAVQGGDDDDSSLHC